MRRYNNRRLFNSILYHADTYRRNRRHQVPLPITQNSSEVLKSVPYIWYRIVGKFGQFGELYMIRQTKTIKISTFN